MQGTFYYLFSLYCIYRSTQGNNHMYEFVWTYSIQYISSVVYILASRGPILKGTVSPVGPPRGCGRVNFFLLAYCHPKVSSKMMLDSKFRKKKFWGFFWKFLKTRKNRIFYLFLFFVDIWIFGMMWDSNICH